ncbi:MAG TPA: ABC transporter permease [Blastocatellia bacterium]
MNGTIEQTIDSVASAAEGRIGLITLPDKPLVSIRPSNRWSPLDLRNVWDYRELLYFLMWRDVKVRYKQTALGVAWAIIQPLLTMVVFSLLFGRLAHVPSDGVPYPLFAFAGLLPWIFVSSAVTASGNSLVANSNLISKVYFPRMIIPAAAVGAALVDFVIGLVLLAVLMVWYQLKPTPGLLMLPVLMALSAVIALGVGMLLSAMNVKYRDVRHALPFMVQIWMFATPVIYPSSIVPAKWRWVLSLNPLAAVIDGFRDCLFGRSFDWSALAISAAGGAVILCYSAYTFRSMEKIFADIV